MKYILITFLFVSTFCFAETCDTIVECDGNKKTTTIIIENDTLYHNNDRDSLVHEVLIEKVVEISKDVYHSVKQKDYGRIVCGALILSFVAYSFYRRRKCKKKN